MSTNWGWVSKQLAGVDASKNVEEATVALLDRLNKIYDERSMTEDEVRLTLDYLTKLQVGHSLIKENPAERWQQCLPGEYQVRDVVRVRADAYTGSHGEKHNGRRGRIARIQQGKAVVIYDGASADESFYHEPEKLERLL